MDLKCKKRAFFSQSDALKALAHIKSSSNYHHKLKKETSFYKCPFCQYWHLTSIHPVEWEIQNEDHQSWQQVRIKTEARFWANRLGIVDEERIERKLFKKVKCKKR